MPAQQPVTRTVTNTLILEELIECFDDSCEKESVGTSADRDLFQINSIRYKNFFLRCNYQFLIWDGMNGICIPGSITRDVAKQSADRAIQGIGFTTHSLMHYIIHTNPGYLNRYQTHLQYSLFFVHLWYQ